MGARTTGHDDLTGRRGGWDEHPGGRVVSIGAVVLAAGLQLVVLVPFTLASGLLAPAWAVVALTALWLAGTALLVRTARRLPLAAPLVPLGNGLLLWLALTAGDVFLGWTA